MYIAAGIFLLLSIFGTAEIAYDYINQTERVRGYNIEDFDKLILPIEYPPKPVFTYGSPWAPHVSN